MGLSTKCALDGHAFTVPVEFTDTVPGADPAAFTILTAARTFRVVTRLGCERCGESTEVKR